jgi:hypothetical protein
MTIQAGPGHLARLAMISHGRDSLSTSISREVPRVQSSSRVPGAAAQTREGWSRHLRSLPRRARLAGSSLKPWLQSDITVHDDLHVLAMPVSAITEELPHCLIP